MLNNRWLQSNWLWQSLLKLTGYPYVYDFNFTRQARASIYDVVKKPWQVHPYRIYKVAPNEITLALSSIFYKNQRIFDYSHEGDWDLKTANIHDMYLFRGLEQRFVQQCPWNENILAPKNISSMDWPEPSQYSIFSEQQFNTRAKELDCLWESLRCHGNLRNKKTKFSDVLAIAIGRDGKLIRMCSGLHRLIMSKMLDLDVVPGRISIIHKDYDRQNFNIEMLS